MPYNIKKERCTQADGDKGNYELSYTDKKGKKHKACHVSKKAAQGQIAAIESSSPKQEGKQIKKQKAEKKKKKIGNVYGYERASKSNMYLDIPSKTADPPDVGDQVHKYLSDLGLMENLLRRYIREHVKTLV